MGKRKKGIRISLSAAVVANSDSFFSFSVTSCILGFVELCF